MELKSFENVAERSKNVCSPFLPTKFACHKLKNLSGNRFATLKARELGKVSK